MFAWLRQVALAGDLCRLLARWLPDHAAARDADTVRRAELALITGSGGPGVTELSGADLDERLAQARAAWKGRRVPRAAERLSGLLELSAVVDLDPRVASWTEHHERARNVDYSYRFRSQPGTIVTSGSGGPVVIRSLYEKSVDRTTDYLAPESDAARASGQSVTSISVLGLPDPSRVVASDAPVDTTFEGAGDTREEAALDALHYAGMFLGVHVMSDTLDHTRESNLPGQDRVSLWRVVRREKQSSTQLIGRYEIVSSVTDDDGLHRVTIRVWPGHLVGRLPADAPCQRRRRTPRAVPALLVATVLVLAGAVTTLAIRSSDPADGDFQPAAPGAPGGAETPSSEPPAVTDSGTFLPAAPGTPSLGGHTFYVADYPPPSEDLELAADPASGLPLPPRIGVRVGAVPVRLPDDVACTDPVTCPANVTTLPSGDRVAVAVVPPTSLLDDPAIAWEFELPDTGASVVVTGGPDPWVMTSPPDLAAGVVTGEDQLLLLLPADVGSLLGIAAVVTTPEGTHRYVAGMPYALPPPGTTADMTGRFDVEGSVVNGAFDGPLTCFLVATPDGRIDLGIDIVHDSTHLQGEALFDGLAAGPHDAQATAILEAGEVWTGFGSGQVFLEPGPETFSIEFTLTAELTPGRWEPDAQTDHVVGFYGTCSAPPP